MTTKSVFLPIQDSNRLTRKYDHKLNVINGVLNIPLTPPHSPMLKLPLRNVYAQPSRRAYATIMYTTGRAGSLKYRQSCTTIKYNYSSNIIKTAAATHGNFRVIYKLQ